MSARKRAMKKRGIKDFPTRDQSEFAREQQHLARRAGPIPSKKSKAAASRRFTIED